MEALFRKDNQKLTVAVSGRLDSNTVHELETELKPNLVGMNELIFDFSNLEYISSAGIRVLLGCYKLVSGNMRILNANEMIIDVFKITGMITVFDIE